MGTNFQTCVVELKTSLRLATKERKKKQKTEFQKVLTVQAIKCVN